MSAEIPNLDEVRAHAQTIVDRAKTDIAFAEALKGDPAGTLREAGLDERAIPDFAAELAEVHAHSPCEYTCLVTCALTRCGLVTM